MTALAIFLQLRLPVVPRPFGFFEIGSGASYEDTALMATITQRRAEEEFLPALREIRALLAQYPDNFCLTLAVNGLVLERLAAYAPAVLTELRTLADTGRVDFAAMPYWGGLSYIYQPDWFVEQVQRHAAYLEELFGLTPRVLANTGLIYNDEVARLAGLAGLCAVVGEMADEALPQSGQVHLAPTDGVVFWPRNRALSDRWCRYLEDEPRLYDAPEPARTLEQLAQLAPKRQVITLWLETPRFATLEGQPPSAGTWLLRALARLTTRESGWEMVLPARAHAHATPAILEQPQAASRYYPYDLSRWLFGEMQREALERIFAHVPTAQRDDWGWLQAAGHFAAMGTLPPQVAPLLGFATPHHAYVNYMNQLTDWELGALGSA